MEEKKDNAPLSRSQQNDTQKDPFVKESQNDHRKINKSGSFMRRDRRNSKAKKKY